MYKVIYRESGKDALYKIWHASDENMIIYMYSDGGSIVCSEKVYPIKSGTLCFIGAHKYHYTMPDNPEIYERSKLFISQDNFKKLLCVLGLEKTFDKTFIYAKIDKEDQKEVDSLFREIKTHESDKSFYEFIASSACIKLLYYLNKYCTYTAIPPSGIVGKAVQYINNNILSKLEVEKISSEIHISKYHLCRQFKIKTGMTIMDYILKTRIVLAKDMLLKDNLSVSEISTYCGFSSVSYFCRVFKNETGKSPLKFRKDSLIQ